MHTESKVSVLVTHKADFKLKSITNNSMTFHIIKGKIHQEDITIINVYALNNKTSKYMKQN